ncbi:MAG TPA: hydantoinase B/oxoprolinase family protein [Burkholderiales bacterium]|jgi:N-methylhydantoinase B|nr:hydantoinase B/oxoprolinase family protein [Burkholderiales bacterium]
MKPQLVRQILWNRLIAVVEEQASVLLKTAFGAITREAGDLSAGVYDTKGRMLAQAVTGTPGHVNTMATAVAHFLERFPAKTLRPGDVLVTNDPWMGTGHLFDFVTVTPAFLKGRHIGFFASTCHVIDIGGRGFVAEATSVYEEGLYVPHMKLFEAGKPNETLFSMLAGNVREPMQVRGDLLGLVSCNEVATRRLAAMLEEFGLKELDSLGEYIVATSRESMLAAIRKLPRGTWRASMKLDGYEAPIELKAALTASDQGIHVDYAGTSPASRFGINSPKCYTDAYTSFGVKCIVAPGIPNNAGSLEVVTVSAPEDTIVNPLRPRAVTARHLIGQSLPELVFDCFEEPLQRRVPAEGAGTIWLLNMSGGPLLPDAPPSATRFNVISIGIGGMGARPKKDGLSTTAFPSGVGAIPVEITEAQSPLLFRRRELAEGSGGEGRKRGGMGVALEIENTEPAPFSIACATFDRRHHPARGRAGGENGRVGRVQLASGRVLPGKETYVVPAGDRLVAEMPGGGGYGKK